MILRLTTNHGRSLSIAIVDEGTYFLRGMLGVLWEDALVPSTAKRELETTLQRCILTIGLFQPFRMSGDSTPRLRWLYSFESAGSMANTLAERSLDFE